MAGPQDRGQDPSPAASESGTTYDAFLSHNSADKPAVTELAQRLREVEIKPFLDAWHLVPGEPWQEALEEALEVSRTCVVFIGPKGFGTWENEEMRVALSRRVANAEFRVIPALLPGAVLPDRGRLPRFLSRMTWVDFRKGLDDPAAFDRLVDGIHGVAPDDPEKVEDAEKPIVCPFRGLEVFDEEHAEYFFGREALTQYLVEQLRPDRFLAVIGPSGSGKSSVVRAGLVPRVRAGDLPGSASWPVVTLRPGPHPLEALASRLAAVLMPGIDVLASRTSVLTQLKENERGLHTVVETSVAGQGVDARVLIVVDQFEEVFTLCHDDAEREAFVDALLHASSVVGGQSVVVITMRADFFGRCATLPVFAARLAERDVLVAPMEKDDVRRSMIQPAELAGLQYEKGLVDTILEAIGSEPGALPLLQHTLFELFQGRRGRWLTIDRYQEIGGVRGAIAQRAEAVYGNLTAAEQTAARRVLLRLTEPGEGTEDTRRRASMTELLPTGNSPDAVEAVVNQLADARLLVTSETDTGDEIVDVAHEALIRGWPRLQGWISGNLAGLRIHRRITETSTEWEAVKRDPSYLFGGQRLVEAQRWAAENDDDLNEVERAFIAASEEAAAKTQRARRRRIQLAIAGTAAAMVLITAAAIAAFAGYREAESARAELAARLLASEGQRIAAEDPLLGLRLEIEGLALAGSAPEAQSDVRDIVADQLSTGRTDSLGQGVGWVRVTADGRYAISVAEQGSSIWRLADRTKVAELPDGICDAQIPEVEHPGIVVLSIDTDCDRRSQSSYELRRLEDGAILSTTDSAGSGRLDPLTDSSVVSNESGQIVVRDAADGRALASGSSYSPLGDTDRVLVESAGQWQLVNATTGELVADLGGYSERVRSRSSEQRAAFGLRDDQDLCTIWAADTGRQLRDPGRCEAITVSPDGSVAAIWTDTGAELLDIASGRHLTPIAPAPSRLTFSPAPGAPTLVAGWAGKAAALIRTRDGAIIHEYAGFLEPQSEDGSETENVGEVEYSNDGRLVFVRAVGSADVPAPEGSVQIAATGEPVVLVAPADPESEPGTIWDVTFSPDAESAFAHIYFTNNMYALYRTSDFERVYDGDDLMMVDFEPPPVGLVILVRLYGLVTVLPWDGSESWDIPGKFPTELTVVPGTDPPLMLLTFEETESNADRLPMLIDASGYRIQLKDWDRTIVSPGGSWYVNGDVVWSRLPKPTDILHLQRSVSDVAFSSDGNRLVVTDQANATAHLIDAKWLDKVTELKATTLDAEPLIKFVCDGPAGTLVDMAALREAMQERQPTACQ